MRGEFVGVGQNNPSTAIKSIDIKKCIFPKNVCKESDLASTFHGIVFMYPDQAKENRFSKLHDVWYLCITRLLYPELQLRHVFMFFSLIIWSPKKHDGFMGPWDASYISPTWMIVGKYTHSLTSNPISPNCIRPSVKNWVGGSPVTVSNSCNFAPLAVSPSSLCSSSLARKKKICSILLRSQHNRISIPKWTERTADLPGRMRASHPKVLSDSGRAPVPTPVKVGVADVPWTTYSRWCQVLCGTDLKANLEICGDGTHARSPSSVWRRPRNLRSPDPGDSSIVRNSPPGAGV